MTHPEINPADIKVGQTVRGEWGETVKHSIEGVVEKLGEKTVWLEDCFGLSHDFVRRWFLVADVPKPEPLTVGLTFDDFSETNAARCARWHPGFPGEDSWSIADWSNAMCGEAGELANVVKKIRRLETGHHSKRPDEQEMAGLVAKAAEEIGDVFAYLDLVATKLGLRVSECAAVKFNAVSEREGYPERIGVTPLYRMELHREGLARPTRDDVLAEVVEVATYARAPGDDSRDYDRGYSDGWNRVLERLTALFDRAEAGR